MVASRTRRVLAALATVVAVAGCGTAGPAPADRFYRVRVDAGTGGTGGAAVAGSLGVQRFIADGLVGERAILFTNGASGTHLQQHPYDYWVEPPPQMLQEEMAHYASRRDLAESVAAPEMRLSVDYVVTGRVRSFERVLGDGPARVRVELRLALKEARGQRRLLWTETYREEEPAGGGGVPEAVEAFNRSVTRIFERFFEDARDR